jgi:hypothetical protein
MRNIEPRVTPATLPNPAPSAPRAPADDAFLTNLLGATNSTAATRAQRRPTSSTYDRVTRRLGLLVGLGVMALLWLTGGYFTLAWLSTLGLQLAGYGVAWVDYLAFGGEPIAVPLPLAFAAWLIPAALTVAEIGLWPARVSHAFGWLLWLAFLAVDAGTTAAGIVPLLGTYPITAWSIAVGIGTILALVPEKGARVLWNLLKDG